MVSRPLHRVLNRCLPTAFACLAVWLAAAPAALAEETLTSVREKAAERIKTHKTFRAKMRLEYITDSKDMRMATVSQGTYEHQLKGELVLFRIELSSATLAKYSHGPDRRGRQQVLTISDGAAAYTLTAQGPRAEATKKPISPGVTTLADPAFFDHVAQKYDVKLLPDETISGRSVWVVETRAKNIPPDSRERTVYYIDVQTGVRIRSASFDSLGRRVGFTDLTDLKIDEPIAPERFEFHLPKGVTLVDLTK